MYHNKKIIVVCLLGFSLFMTSCNPGEEKKTTYYEEGNAFLVQGELDDAETSFKHAIAMDERYGEAYIKLGITKMRQGDLKSAFAAFTRASQINPHNLHVQLRLATFYMLGRDFPRALNVLDAVLLKEPDNTEALFLRGSLLAQQNSLKQAERVFQRIIKLDASQVRAYLALIKTKTVLGDTKDVISLLHTAIENNPHALDLKLALVDRYLSLEKVPDAKGVLLDALQHDPGNPVLQEILGTFYFRIGQMNMAESAYKEAVKLSSGELKPLMTLARFYTLTGDEEHAASTYEMGVEMAPGNVQVLDTVSRFYAHNGKVDQAEIYVDRALEANPTFLPSRILQMELALEKKNFDETLRLSSILLDEGKKLPKIYYLRGMALLALGESKKAEAALLNAVDGWSGYIRARIGLARVYYDGGDYRKAGIHAAAALKQAPASLDARLILGSVAERMGDTSLAMRYYRDALQIDPEYGPAANNLAYLLVKEGKDLDEAMELAQCAMKKMPEDAGVLDTLGWIHYRKGDADAAVTFLAGSVARDAGNPVFSYHLGMAYLKQGKNPEAQSALENALKLDAAFEGASTARAALDILENVEKKTEPEGHCGE